MTGADAISVVVCVAFGAAALSLAVEPILTRIVRRRQRKPRVNAALAAPIKLPVTHANRAMRARRANVVWNLPDWSIADKLGPYDAEMVDLQHLAELFVDGADL